MNISLILTRQCNLRCRYCFETHEDCMMTEDTALRAVDFVAKHSGQNCGISFFGGEPLLCKNLIYKCVERANTHSDKIFRYNMTTNGLMLDEEFLKFACSNDIDIALSHDGLMSHANRIYSDGHDCFNDLNEKLSMLLRYQPNAFIMATVTPDTVDKAADSVIYLYRMGVKRINMAIDSRPYAGWDDRSMDELGRQLKVIADFVLSEFKDGRNLSFNQFDEKIFSVTRRKPCHICRLGRRKLYINADGVIYPCIQFIGLPRYRVGEVKDGIDETARDEIYSRSLKKPEFCRGCALEPRCVNDCACLNFHQCGNMDEISPVQCSYQRMLIATADNLARGMLEADEKRFIKRYF